MNKNQQISLMIMTEVANGKTIQEAYDAIMGEGAYQKLAAEIYDELKNK